jgi:hypothetical protein
MLAKKVYSNGGVLKIPGMTPDVEPTEMRMSADWISSQRFQK